MPAFIVEIETPTGRKIRKGTVAGTVEDAIAGIRHLQQTYGMNGIPKCQQGRIVDAWEREKGRPLPQGVLKNPKAVQILQHFRF
jgi:hypothetical protein